MEEFRQQLLQLLNNARIIRGQGQQITLTKAQFPNAVVGLSTLMDGESRKQTQYYKFCYNPVLSDANQLTFMDTTYGLYTTVNALDVIAYSIDPATGLPTPQIISSTRGRTGKVMRGNTAALFNDLNQLLCPLFPHLTLEIKTADIEMLIHKNSHIAGIFMVPFVNAKTIADKELCASQYVKINHTSIGVISDGYDFHIITKPSNLLISDRTDFIGFARRLIERLR